jgi:hypothetical protein
MPGRHQDHLLSLSGWLSNKNLLLGLFIGFKRRKTSFWELLIGGIKVGRISSRHHSLGSIVINYAAS